MNPKWKKMIASAHEAGSYSLFFAVEQAVGRGQSPIGAWLPPAGEGLFLRGATSDVIGLPWRAVA